ncbi:sterol desaturase family protein [Acetobacter sp. AN02]|uniref:sterol desaturase family protein n=1 Tax=Acetobacter sp. AN02 TaxID=2894186 RepID=UPI0038D18188
MLFFNLCEYVIHKSFGHRKNPMALPFYKRHTGDHHNFFSDSEMYFDRAQDWRVILFPPWLIVVIFLLLGVFYGLALLSMNFSALFCIAVLGSYLCYEIFHVCVHAPEGCWFTNLPWIRQVRYLHTIHHRCHLMADRNFNILFPLTDVILKTIVLK